MHNNSHLSLPRTSFFRTRRPPSVRNTNNRIRLQAAVNHEMIPPPYPWAAQRRATVQSLNHLLSAGTDTIGGDVQCHECHKKYEMEFDLQLKFAEVASFIHKHEDSMHRRAPPAWMNPTLPDCRFCGGTNSAKPVISDKKKRINWLFLLLGQMLGCCTLQQLRYFCKHTKNHRTGDKRQLLYCTYLVMCKQLDPEGPFDP